MVQRASKNDWLHELLSDVMAEDGLQEGAPKDHVKSRLPEHKNEPVALVHHSVKEEWLFDAQPALTPEGAMLQDSGVLQRLQALEEVLHKSQQREVLELQRLSAEERSLRSSSFGLSFDGSDVDDDDVKEDLRQCIRSVEPQNLLNTEVDSLLHTEQAFREEAQVRKAENASLENELVVFRSAADDALQQKASLEQRNAELLAEAATEESRAAWWRSELGQATRYRNNAHWASECAVIMDVRDILVNMQINRLIALAWSAWERVAVIICLHAWRSFAMEWRWNCAERSHHVQAELEVRMADMNIELQSSHFRSQNLCRRFGDAYLDFFLRMAIALWSGRARDWKWENHATGWKDYMWERFASDSAAGHHICDRFASTLRTVLLRLCIVTWHLEVQVWRLEAKKQAQRLARSFTPSLEFQLSELAEHTRELCTEVSDLSQARSQSVKQEHKLEQVARWWCGGKGDDPQTDPFRVGLRQAFGRFVERQTLISDQYFFQCCFCLWSATTSGPWRQQDAVARSTACSLSIAACFGVWSRRCSARRAAAQTRQQEAKHMRAQVQVLVEQRDALLEQTATCEEELCATVAALQHAEIVRDAADAQTGEAVRRGEMCEERLEALEARQQQIREAAHAQITSLTEQNDSLMQRSVSHQERLCAAESAAHSSHAWHIQAEERYLIAEMRTTRMEEVVKERDSALQIGVMCEERLRTVEALAQASQARHRRLEDGWRTTEEELESARACEIIKLTGERDAHLRHSLEHEEKLQSTEVLLEASHLQGRKAKESLRESREQCCTLLEQNMTCRTEFMALESSVQVSKLRRSEAREAEAEERCRAAEERVEQLEAYVQNAMLFFQPP